MATGSPTKDVKDPNYRNWLKVSLSLWYMKRALHLFVGNEVDLMHTALLQKIYGGQTVPQTRCTSCSASNIKQNRHTRVWGFGSPPCPMLCHVWLSELLNLRLNPGSDRIYWGNCDVMYWPFSPWECAKAFMPRGQQPSNKGPDDTDAQAILTLISNCKHFHGKLTPQGLKRTHLVSTIRNIVMHAADMKLSDADMKNFIREIIEFLEDPVHLRALEGCKKSVSDIIKIRDAKVDVFFDLDLEMKALRECVIDIREQIGTDREETGNTISILKEEFNTLRARNDSLTMDMEGVRQTLDDHKSELEGVHQVLDSHSSDLEGVHQVLDSQSSDLDGVHRQLTFQSSDLEGVHQVLHCYTRDLENVHRVLDSHSSKFENVCQNLDHHKNDLQGVHLLLDTRFNTVKENLQALQDRVDSNQCQYHALQKNVLVQKDKQNILQKNLQSLDGTVETKLRKQEERIKTIDEDMVKIAKDITEMKQDTKSLVDRGQEKGRIDIINIQKLLIESYKDIQTVQLSPVFEDRLGNIETYYTDVYIEKESGEINRDRQSRLHNDKVCVKSLRQLFLKGDDKIKRIVLKGSAGLGKSTFCRKLVYTWCTFQTKRLNLTTIEDSSIKTHSNEMMDMDVMLMFDILLFISLREILCEKNIIDVIHTQIPFLECTRNLTKETLQTMMEDVEDNKVLMIMDGLDEMNVSAPFIEQILKRKLYPAMTVVMSSRPWKIGQLRLSQPVHVDLLLNVGGFSWWKSMQFAEKILDNYYEDKTAMQHFEVDIRKSSIICGLIHVPLLMLFLVHVWYRKKSFPETVLQVYLEMLDLMVERYIEKKKNVSISWHKRTSRKRLKHFSKVRELSIANTFSEDFLLEICEIACNCLFGNQQENSLVFEERSLVSLLGNNGELKLQLALDIGILSKQERAVAGQLKREISMSFPHKTIQELLAAIYLCCTQKAFSKFLCSLKTYSNVFENEMIIMFIAGMSSHRCEKVFERIFEACNNDDDVYEEIECVFMDEDASINDTDIAVSFHRLVKQCLRETSAGEQVKLKLRQLHACDLLELNTVLSSIKSIRDVRCLSLENFNLLPSVGCATRIYLPEYRSMTHLALCSVNVCDYNLDFSLPSSLRKVCLVYVRMNTENSKQLCNSLSRCTQLQELKLVCVDLDDGKLDLSRAFRLSVLWLQSVTMSRERCNHLCYSISRCKHLQKLILKEIDLYDGQLDLSGGFSITYIWMRNVNMSSDGALWLCNSVSKCSQLQKLELNNVDLGDGRLDLSRASFLSEVWIQNVTLSSESAGLLFNSLSLCKQLRKLRLMDVDLGVGKLDLSATCILSVLWLEHMNMSSESAEVLLSTFLSQFEHLLDVRVHVVIANGSLSIDSYTFHCYEPDIDSISSHHGPLFDIGMSNATPGITRPFLSICKSLSKTKKLKGLRMENVTIDDGVLDLSGAFFLSRIKISQVTMPSESTFLLCNSLSQCTELEELKFANLDLDESQLNLSRASCLREVKLDRVNMSSDCAQLLCDSLRHCPLLEKFILRHVNIGQCKLNLVLPSSISKLCFENVIMSDESAVLLCDNLYQCNQLTELTLSHVNINEGKLDLSQASCLWKLNLDNITPSVGSAVFLCDRLSQYTNLWRLTLGYINLGDGTLDLSQAVRLSELCLEHVTLSNECAVVLLKSLSQCAKLKMLELDDINLSDGKPDRSRAPFLSNFTLQNITMSSQSTVQLFSILSQFKKMLDVDEHDCTEILKLNVDVNVNDGYLKISNTLKFQFSHQLILSNVSLGDATLDLSWIFHLSRIWLESVTMSNKSAIELCKDLSRNIQLQELRLVDINLQDGKIDLSEILSLSTLFLCNVVMPCESAVLLFNSMSMCTQLQELTLWHVNVGDGKLDLSVASSLSQLCISTAAISSESAVILCNSLSQCSKMQNLKIESVNLGDARLDLSGNADICRLNLWNVTFSRGNERYLRETLSNCTRLHCCWQNEIDLPDGRIILSGEWR